MSVLLLNNPAAPTQPNVSRTRCGGFGLLLRATVVVAIAIPDPTPAPPALSVRRRTWTWTLVNGTDEIEISRQVKGRHLTWALTDAATATFALNGRLPIAQSVVEMATDLVIYADGVQQFRGRVSSTQDQLTEDRHDLSVTAVGYKGLLSRRELDDNDVIVYEQMDKFTIAWALITAVQAKPGGDLGITLGNASLTGQMTDRVFEPGQNVAELIDQMGHEFLGYDWDIDAQRRFQLWSPRRSNTLETPLQFGSTVAGVDRQLASSGFANVLRVAGDSTIDPALRPDPAITISPYGRWEKSITFSNAKTADVLSGYADIVSKQLSTLPVSYTVRLRPGVWPGVNQMGPGDVAPFVISSGRLNINQFMRITYVDLELTDDGAETITLTLIEPDWFDPALVGT